MKNIFTLSVAALMGVSMVTGCSSDDAIAGNGDGQNLYDGTEASIPAMKIDEGSRTSLVYSSNGMVLSWEKDDKIATYPKYVDSLDLVASAGESPMTTLSLIEGTASSDGIKSIRGKFGLDNKRYILEVQGDSGHKYKEYLAFYPGGKVKSKVGYTAIPVNFDKQVQQSNVEMKWLADYKTSENKEVYQKYINSEKAASAHLSDYDYLCANGTRAENGATLLEFTHLPSTVRFYMKVPDQDNAQVFDSLVIFSKDKKFIQEATVNLETQAVTEVKSSNRQKLDFGTPILGNDSQPTGKYSGFDFKADDAEKYFYTQKTGQIIVAYMEMLPIDLSSEELAKPILYLFGHREFTNEAGDKEITKTYYRAYLSRKNIEQGKAYQWSVAPTEEEAIEFEEIQVQVWQKETQGFTNGVGSDAGKGTENW